MKEKPEFRSRIVEFLPRVPAADLAPNPRNWRKHGKAQRQALEAVLKSVGVAGAVLARRRADGALELIDGHLRQSAMREVPVLVLDVDEAEADVILATFDPIAEMAKTDAAQLRSLLDAAASQDAALVEVLGRIAKDHGIRDELPDEDEPKVEATHRVVAGEIWALGSHRLVCGDCTSADVVTAALAGERPGLLLTDPPYGIGERFDGGTGSGWDKSRSEKHARNAWDAAPSREVERFAALCEQSIVWGGNYFEVPPARGWLVWVKPERGFSLADAELAWTTLDIPVRVLELPRHEKDRAHPTQKPLALMAWCLDLADKANRFAGLVFDPYAGSGTTLIACEQSSRVCVAIERHPEYCDLILCRWESLTGQKAKRVEALQAHAGNGP